MLNVSYVNPLGYVVVTEKHGSETKKFKFDLCFANIKLFAEVEHTGEAHRLHLFFMDNEHLKRIVRAEGEDAKYFLAGRHYHFNSFYRAANSLTVELLTRLGAEVSFFYEDPNKIRKKH